MLTAMVAAGLGTSAADQHCRGAALARDIARADCQILLTDSDHRELIDGLELPGVTVFEVDSAQWAKLNSQAPELNPHREVV